MSLISTSLYFDSPYLKLLTKVLIKRRKAIKYQIKSGEFQKVIEKEANKPDVEKLEITLNLTNQIVLRLFVWGDRWVWIDVRRSSKKGWLFEWESSGRVLQDSERIVVSALEQSFLYAKTSNETELIKIWNKVLFNGPKRIQEPPSTV